MQSWKNSAFLPIAIIVLILVASGIAIFTIRKGNDDDVDINNNPTTTATPTDEPTTTGTVTATPSGSTTPTASTSATPTPTATTTPVVTDGEDPAVTDALNTAWLASATIQQSGSQTYFISGKDVKKGSSETDTGASTVYTSVNGDVKSILLVGTNTLYVAEGRNSSNNESRLVKYTISSKKTSLVFKYVAARAEVYSFLVNTKNAAEFYLTFATVNNSVQPIVAFEKNYVLDWSKTISGTTKSEVAKLRGVSADNTKLILTITNTSTGASRNVDYVFE